MSGDHTTWRWGRTLDPTVLAEEETRLREEQLDLAAFWQLLGFDPVTATLTPDSERWQLLLRFRATPAAVVRARIVRLFHEALASNERIVLLCLCSPPVREMEAIAALWGTTRTRAYQIKNKALRRLRQPQLLARILAEPPGPYICSGTPEQLCRICKRRLYNHPALAEFPRSPSGWPVWRLCDGRLMQYTRATPAAPPVLP